MVRRVLFTLVGHFEFNGKSYWVSWFSNESALRNARWNWFTGRNYCRKMCMDMVSLETKAEQDFIHRFLAASNVNNIHTAGRLCDKEVEGCEGQPRSAVKGKCCCSCSCCWGMTIVVTRYLLL